MSEDRVVWIDGERCTGCGACIEVCPVGAIALVNNVARVDEESCTGCAVCIDTCPQDAIQPVVEGELVPVEDRGLTDRRASGQLAPAVERPRSLVDTAAPAAAAVGLGLLARAADALAGVVSRWLAAAPEEGPTPPTTRDATDAPRRANGRGRRMRQRRRGR
ncbi:MAG: 4Fe-4S binding protein [Anaerolineae bacterium]